jgi:hypothetical protein
MWIFGRHRHLSLEVLSEYLDRRLSNGEREGISRRLNSCSLCREELDSLQVTVSLLQGLEDAAIPRNFTLAGPPPAPAVARQPLPFRAPNWAYAGAASLAGLALAFMVSADAAGLLAPSAIPVASQQATAMSTSEALPTAGPEIASEPQTESQQLFRDPEAPNNNDTVLKTDQTPLPEGADQPPAAVQDSSPFALTPSNDATGNNGGAAGPSGTPAPEDFALGQAAPEGGPAESERMTTMSEPARESGATEEVPTSEPSAVPQLALVQKTETPLVWRVLEGVAAALAIVLIGVFAFKRRRDHRIANN